MPTRSTAPRNGLAACFWCATVRNTSVMWTIWLDNHKRTLCEPCWERWQTGTLPVMVEPSPFDFEELDPTEAEHIWLRLKAARRSSGRPDLSAYLDFVRAMEGGKRYRVKLHAGTTALAAWNRLAAAAKLVDLALEWPAGRPNGPAAKGLTEVYVQLATEPRPLKPEHTDRKNGSTNGKVRPVAAAARAGF